MIASVVLIVRGLGSAYVFLGESKYMPAEEVGSLESYKLAARGRYGEEDLAAVVEE